MWRAIVSALTGLALLGCGELEPGVARLCLTSVAVTPVGDLRRVTHVSFALDGPLPEGVTFDDTRADIDVVATLGGGFSTELGRAFFDTWLLRRADDPGEVVYLDRVADWYDQRNGAPCLGPEAPADVYVRRPSGLPEHVALPLRPEDPGTVLEVGFVGTDEERERGQTCVARGGQPLTVLAFADGDAPPEDIGLCVTFSPRPRFLF